MRQFAMTVVERREPFEGVFATHPFETAWAGEAIFFVRVEELAAEAEIRARVQISADGIRWVDEGTIVGPLRATGDSATRVSHFGGWLRLEGEITGPDPRAKLTIQLALKE